MIRAIYTCAILLGFLLFTSTSADAYCTSYTTISNGTPADATQVMSNFGCAALTSGSTIEGLTSTNGQYFTYGTDAFSGYDNSLGLSSNNFLYLQGKSTGGLWLAGSHGRNNNIAIWDALNEIRFYTNGHSNADLLINSSGNVGIGTTNPYTKLHVAGPIALGGTTSDTASNFSTWANVEAHELLASASAYWGIREGATNHEINFDTWHSQNSPKTPLTILQGGNVGIGTPSPTHTLDVNGTLNVVGAITCGSGCPSGPWSVSGSNIIPASTSYNVGIGTTSPTRLLTVQGVIAAVENTTNMTSAVVKTTGDVARFISTYESVSGSYKPLSLMTSGSDRLFITTSGDVGIGTTSPSYTLHVNGSVAGTSAYNNLSDARLKKDVIPLIGGLSVIEQLQPVRYRWRTASERKVGKDLELPSESQVGFLAQDVSKVIPEAVSTAKGKDAIMSVAESKIVPALVAAVQELKAANDRQALEIARLRTRDTAMLKRLERQANQMSELRTGLSRLKHGVLIQTAANPSIPRH